MKMISKDFKYSTIFVQIANYRDADFDNTIDDLLLKATHPERITLGICWQTLKGDHPIKRRKNMRVIKVDAAESKGVCWARSQTQKLWRGEDFTLQLDAHHRFEPGWDETLLKMWKACSDKKAVISVYGTPLKEDYEYHGMVDKSDRIFGMAARRGASSGILNLNLTELYKPNKAPLFPFKGAFIGACFLFGPAQIIQDVPYDPHIYFFGEELTLSARLWTHGYNIFHPNITCIYHNWRHTGNSRYRKNIADFKKKQAMLNRISFARVRHLLGIKKTTNPLSLIDIEHYGLGNKRSLKEYEKWSGIDFKKKKFYKIKNFSSLESRRRAKLFSF